MEHLVYHVLGALALLFSGFALFLNRRGVRATRRTQKLSDIIPKAVDAALRHHSQGANRSIDIRTFRRIDWMMMVCVSIFLSV